MKFIAAAMLGAAMALAGPVMAQDRDKASDHDKIDTSQDRIDASMQHRVTHHRVTYRRTYKTDQDEHQATEDLNRQYRGMPASDAR